MKKTIVQVNGLQVLGEIEEDDIEAYVLNNVPLGVEVLIGDDIDDIVSQIRIRLRLQGNRDIKAQESVLA